MQQCAAPSWNGAAQRRSAYCCNSDAIHQVHDGSGAGALRYSEYSHWGTHQVHDGSGAGARGRDEQPRLELRVGLRHSEGSRARCGLVGVLVRIPIGMVAARVRVSACVCARLCTRGSEVFLACARACVRAGVCGRGVGRPAHCFPSLTKVREVRRGGLGGGAVQPCAVTLLSLRYNSPRYLQRPCNIQRTAGKDATWTGAAAAVQACAAVPVQPRGFQLPACAALFSVLSCRRSVRSFVRVGRTTARSCCCLWRRQAQRALLARVGRE